VSAISAASADPAPRDALRTGRALVVDDEAELAETLAELLQAKGWATRVATCGEDAIALLREQDFDLLLTDVRMPGIDGPALYRWLVLNRPALAGRTGFLTGDTLGPHAGAFLADVGRPFAEKPLSAAAIDRLVAEVLAAPSSQL
jgi:CheY-like chemotaxis protein